MTDRPAFTALGNVPAPRQPDQHITARTFPPGTSVWNPSVLPPQPVVSNQPRTFPGYGGYGHPHSPPIIGKSIPLLPTQISQPSLTTEQRNRLRQSNFSQAKFPPPRSDPDTTVRESVSIDAPEPQRQQPFSPMHWAEHLDDIRSKSHSPYNEEAFVARLHAEKKLDSPKYMDESVVTEHFSALCRHAIDNSKNKLPQTPEMFKRLRLQLFHPFASGHRRVSHRSWQQLIQIEQLLTHSELLLAEVLSNAPIIELTTGDDDDDSKDRAESPTDDEVSDEIHSE
jgi:hypothetical protein